MNNTMGENGFVPAHLAFGIFYRFIIFNTKVCTQETRLKANRTAQAEMITIFAERKICKVLFRDIQSASDRIYEHGIRFW